MRYERHNTVRRSGWFKWLAFTDNWKCGLCNNSHYSDNNRLVDIYIIYVVWATCHVSRVPAPVTLSGAWWPGCGCSWGSLTPVLITLGGMCGPWPIRGEIAVTWRLSSNHSSPGLRRDLARAWRGPPLGTSLGRSAPAPRAGRAAPLLLHKILLIVPQID